MNNQSFIYDLLVTPRYRPLRHILLIFGFTVLSVNQALFNCNDLFSQFAHGLLIVAIILSSYLICVYISLYIFIPKYLLAGKYLKFVISIVLLILVFMTVQKGLNFIILGDEDMSAGFILLDLLSTFFIDILCFAGITIPFFLRHWLISRQRVSQLEKKQLSSEIEQLKEQINPAFLFDILSTASQLVKTEPEKVSKMLMILSRLLRYQLYDCNRDKVFLHSEITFLSGFLELESLYLPHFNYSVEIEDGAKQIFIPPLLLFPFVQLAVKSMNKDIPGSIHLKVGAADGRINMSISIKGIAAINQNDEEWINARERISHLSDDYILDVSENEGGITTINLKMMTQP